MGWGIGNLGMLFGLTALAVPLLVHLMRRRRRDVVAWGAMQFLPASVRVRQRRFWDELPLMALRMALVALLVLALAGPYSTSALFAPLSERPARDVVIVLDGSYPMDRRDAAGQTPWRAAVRWAGEHIAQLGRGERAALLVARRPPFWVQPDLIGDRAELQARLEALGASRGNRGLPAALAEAWRLLGTSEDTAEQEIILLTDRRHFGWADDDTRQQWEAVGRQLHTDAERRRAGGQAVPRLRLFDVTPGQAGALPDFALSPLTAGRPLAAIGQSIKFTGTLHRNGAASAAIPRHIRVAVDGVHAQDIPVRAEMIGGAAQMPFSFTLRFDTPGLHAVTATLDTQGAPDAIPADTEQHTVVEVVGELPVLLVDGDREPGQGSSTYFLDKALAGSGAYGPAMPRIVPCNDLTPSDILGTPQRARPRVIVLADVPALSPHVSPAMAAYLREGGGVLVGPGARAEASVEFYNRHLYRGGEGWLPAPLGAPIHAVVGTSVRPDPASFQHPALTLFRQGFGDVTLPLWWRLDGNTAAGTVVARLTNGAPLLVEKRFGKGRTLLLSMPLDRSWDSPLPGTWEFPVLVHEIITYLAGARKEDWLLQEGQPLRVGPAANGAASGAAPERLVVRTPEVESKTVQVRHWPWTDANSGAIGLYRIEREDGSRQLFVVPPDLREAEDRRCTDAEWTGVLNLLPVRASTEAGAEPIRRHEVWWLCLLGVMGLLCVEIFLTRRLALRRRFGRA